jgi:DNA-binding transcriptional ArsR family regulator
VEVPPGNGAVICIVACTYTVGYIRAMESVLQAIADDNRRILLGQLRRGPSTVNELAALLPIARPGVSRHLRILREAGLVDVRADAQSRIYSLRAEPLKELDDWLGDYRAQWEQRLDALHTEVARGKRRSGNE